MPNTENHPETIITPARAREALQCIADLTGPVPADHWAIVTLSEVLRQFEEALRGEKAHEETSCPGCQVARFIIPFTTDHLAHCPDHPAVRRARAVRDAVRLAPEVVRSLRLEPVTLDPARPEAIDELVAIEVPRWKGGWTFLRDASWLRHSIEFLTGTGRKKYPEQVAGHVRELDEAMEAWRRIVHRGSDPCPYCGAVLNLDEVIDHLLRCKHHPATVLADEAFAALAASLGKAGAEMLVKLVEERNGQVDGLRALILACNIFDGDLGWNGEESYARGYVEDALKRAVVAARQRAGVGDPEYRPNLEPVAEAASGPAFARTVWRAALRVTTEGPTPGSHAGSEEDGALLRATYQEMLRLHEQLSGEQECAACGRHGIFTHNAVRHVAECLLSPAIARQRAAAAEVQLASAILKEKRPGQALPEIARDRGAPIRLLLPSAYWRSEAARRAQARKYFEQSPPLDFLLSPEQRGKYPISVGSYRERLVHALSTWQRLALVERSECPFCGEEAPLDALLRHVLACASHPAVQEARVHESRLAEVRIDPPGVATRLRREADRARMATVRLLECTESFRGSFGDDDRGRATISRDLEPAWNWETNVAENALRGLEGKVSPPIERYARLLARWAIFVPKGDGRTWVSSLVVPPPTSIGVGWLALLDALFVDLIARGWRPRILSSAAVDKEGALSLTLEGMTPELLTCVDEARAESRRTCERCGAAGRVRTAPDGTMRTRCGECEAAETVH